MKKLSKRAEQVLKAEDILEKLSGFTLEQLSETLESDVRYLTKYEPSNVEDLEKCTKALALIKDVYDRRFKVRYASIDDKMKDLFNEE
jgi:DNA-directed RNA polymerase subunit F